MPSTGEKHLQAQLAAHTSWANTTDRTGRTAKARAALDQKFLDQAGGDPVRAEHLRKAHYAKLALKSAKSRRKAKELATDAGPSGCAETSGRCSRSSAPTPCSTRQRARRTSGVGLSPIWTTTPWCAGWSLTSWPRA